VTGDHTIAYTQVLRGDEITSTVERRRGNRFREIGKQIVLANRKCGDGFDVGHCSYLPLNGEGVDAYDLACYFVAGVDVVSMNVYNVPPFRRKRIVEQNAGESGICKSLVRLAYMSAY
jgi:hypothetical protein